MNGLDLLKTEHERIDGLFDHRAAYVELGCRVTDSAYVHLKELNRTREGYITTTTEQRTSIPGLFAVGDCLNYQPLKGHGFLIHSR